ncbi:C-C chemokine receptor type 2-like [Pempheris klunzingeri]|uniref:C-C chemokine receptor type 2-like n=1 Tax=Pempheris klunzingeri TaxID=3127111 RepID=UPI00397F6BD8
MSGDGANATDTTTIYDYSQYYEFDNDFIPCNSVDVRNFGKVFLPTLYSLVFILGFVGNGLVVCVLVKHRNQTNLTDICLFNLALSDLLFVVALPFYSHFSAVSDWTFGEFMCRFFSSSHNTGFFSNIFFMVVMTLDRYVVIMHTHSVARYRTLRAGITMSAFVWMLSLGISVPAFIFTKVINGSHGLGCEFIPENDGWRLYNLITINVLGLMIPLLVMVVSYSRIIPTLVNMRSTKKHRVVKLIISLVVVFFLFWAPYNISLFLLFLKSEGMLQGDACKLENNLRLSLTVTEALAYTHCCLNPIIYAFLGQKFMKRTMQMLRKWVQGIQPTGDFSSSSVKKTSVIS